MRDELPELRALDHPMPVPAEFSRTLREELSRTFDERSTVDPIGPDDRIQRGETDHARSPRWAFAAAILVLVTLSAALIRYLDSDQTEPARQSSCEAFVADSPAAEKLHATAPLPIRRLALEELNASIDQLIAALVRTGEVGAADISRLEAANSGLREARLDLDAGDQAGSEAAIEFALDRLAELERINISLGFGLGEQSVSCDLD